MEILKEGKGVFDTTVIRIAVGEELCCTNCNKEMLSGDDTLQWGNAVSSNLTENSTPVKCSSCQKLFKAALKK